MKRTYIVTWEEITDGGVTEYNHTVIESEDNPKAILITLRNHGLSYELGPTIGDGAHIYEIGKAMTSLELLKSIGFHERDSFALIDFLKTLKLP